MARQADILIIGAGLAGSAAALVLARRGLQVTIFDKHEVYPPDFRCEKLSPAHVEIARRLDLLTLIEPQARLFQNVTIAHRGGIVGVRQIAECGLRYESLVNALRAAWPDNVEFVAAQPARIETGPYTQTVATHAGLERRGRLVLMATGTSGRARRLVGIEGETTVDGHTLTAGFSLRTTDGRPFPFESLTYYGEHGDRLGYVTLFPVDDALRVNAFCYPDDARRWVADFRRGPLEALRRIAPGLGRFVQNTEIVGAPSFRVSSLQRVADPHRDGVVLLGEAFQSTSPATGTGALCVLNDVERLCTVHLPRWLASGDMSAGTLAAFYRDPVKRACDERSWRASHEQRSIAVDPAIVWRARRALVRLRSRLACEIDEARRAWAA